MGGVLIQRFFPFHAWLCLSLVLSGKHFSLCSRTHEYHFVERFMIIFQNGLRSKGHDMIITKQYLV